jgi:threonine/homoserine/homoserine lactone efflux protein
VSPFVSPVVGGRGIASGRSPRHTLAMPPFSSVAAFAALSFALIVVPGPSVMFIVSRGVALGRRVALITALGNSAGVYVQMVFVALGLGAIVGRSIAVFTGIKLAGALYLVWLGIQAIRHRRDLGRALDTAGIAGSSRSVFLEGFIVGVTNPKAIVFFAAILPQFVTETGPPPALQMAILGVVFVAVALLSDGTWGMAAGSARQWLARSPRRSEWFGASGGVVMILLGAQLALTGRKD